MRTIGSLFLAAILTLGCATVSTRASADPPAAEAATQVKQTPVPQIPTLEDLEARVKEYSEKYPELVKQVQQMQVDILILQGAIAREYQLTGKTPPAPPVEVKPEEKKPN